MAHDFESDAALFVEARRRLSCEAKARFELWQENGALSEAILRHEFLDQNAVPLSALLIEVIPALDDRFGRTLVEGLLLKALGNAAFFKTFAGALVKHGIHVKGKMESYFLSKWAVIIMQKLPLPENQKPITKLLSMTGRCLDQLHGKAFNHSMQRLRRLTKSNVKFCEELQSASVDSSSTSLLRIVCETLPKDQSQFREKLLANYCTNILTAKSPPSSAIQSAYQPLLATLTKAEFGETVLPALTRSVKRNAEVAVHSVSVLFESMNLDISAFGTELQKVMTELIRHSNAEVQNTALRILSTISKRITDRDVIQQMAVAVVAVLSGKVEGKIKNIQERMSLAKAFSSISSSTAKNHETSVSVIQSLNELYQSEVNDDVKGELLKSEGSWLEACQRIPDVMIQGLKHGLNGKEGLRNSALCALAQRHGQVSLFSSIAELAPSLSKIVESGLGKVHARAEGIAAFLVLSLITAADPKTDDSVNKSGIWNKALASSSLFFDSNTIAKLPDTTVTYLAALCEHLLLLHIARVDSTEGCLGMLCQTLVLLCLHGSKSVRNAAFNSVAQCLRTSSSLCVPFLKAFQSWQLHDPDIAILLGSNGESDRRLALMEIKDRYRQALMHLLPLEIESDALAPLLLVSHHSLLQKAKDSSSMWRTLSKRNPDLQSMLEGSLEETLNMLLSESGVKNDCLETKAAALAAITTCAKRLPSALFEIVVPFVEHHVDKSEADALTKKDVLIFKTPEGRLSTEIENTVVIIQDSRKKAKKKKPKGRYRHEKIAFAEQSESSSEEEEVEDSVQTRIQEKPKTTSKGKKPGHMDAADRQQAFREKQLVEETDIRSRVTEIQKHMATGLQVLRACILGNVNYAAGHIEAFSNLIVPLLTSELVGRTLRGNNGWQRKEDGAVGEGAAFEALESLATTLPSPLNLIPLDVAVVLRLIAMHEQNQSISVDTILSHLSTIAVMHGIATIEAQGSGAFFLLLPVLRIALQHAQSAFFDSALTVLTGHCVPGESLPKTETLDLLYQTLSLNPATKSSTVAFVYTLSISTVLRRTVIEALKNLCLDVIDDEMLSVLNGLLYTQAVVRSAALEALFVVPAITSGIPVEDDHIASLLLVACHDIDDGNGLRAKELYDAAGAEITESQLEKLAPLIGHDAADIREAAVRALVEFIQSQPQMAQKLIEFVVTTISDGCSKEWFLGGALLFELCCALFSPEQTRVILEFLLTEGMTHADDGVRGKMVEAGLALVDAYDPRDIDSLFQLLDRKLSEIKAGNKGHETDDRMREGAVVLLGTVAKQLPANDPNLKAIISNLLEVLSTPSEAVQRAASVCLSPLMAKCQSNTQYTTEVITALVNQVASGESYGHRRGAAFGIAGVVKGLGISSLKNYGIMDILVGYVEDKSKAATREGGISTFDCLSQSLGKLFEPYVIHTLPLLLTCFGDAALSVRQATADASKTIMHNLSAQGVKLVMPSLMKGLEDKAWRTKQGSIQLLSAMAWCAPKQLSTCLPTIVPKLITVLADPHPKVHTAAEFALEEVGSTIRNPEMQQLVPDILKAIAYPAQHTVSCLDKLLESRFQNTIDPPSLALVVPVVHYGLKDRSGEHKKRAARIVQNLCKLVNDPKDMDPYIELLLPELKKGIVDTLPDVRAQAAKALGGLMFDMGKQALEEVMPWLLEMLESKSSAVERSGAAQAISEVLAVFGQEYFESILPKILQNCSSSVAILREGGVAVLRYLPYSMPDLFQEKLDEALPFILDGLADENESVRDISLAAGRTLVDVYAQTSLPVILPAVEQSLFHANWRIRQSSIELLGNLIFKVAGTSGKVKLDGDSDDEGPATQSYEKNLIRALGLQRRNSVLAKLYMSRSDVQHPVRVAALHIWKTVVMNTPKTLTEMLNALMDLMIEMLAFGEEDGRQTSARCLGELVKKMGDRFLPKIVPIMQECFASDNPETREGVCHGLRELLESLTSFQLAEYLPTLLPTIQSTLCDENLAVREAAATAFDAMFKAGASSVVESVIPNLLLKLEDEKQSDKALEGLRVILSIRPHTFENMLPKLLKEPLSVQRLTAIASMADVASGALRSHLTHLLQSLMSYGSRREETALVLAAQEAAKKVVIALPDEHLQLLMNELRKGVEDNALRFCAALLISTVAESRPIGDYVESLLQVLVSLMSEDDSWILDMCWNAMKSVAATVPKELRPTFIRVLSDSVKTSTEKAKRRDPGNDSVTVNGFCRPDGIGPILPFYIEGVQAASGELRESSAIGLGELIEVTDASSLKNFVGLIMGPLIRIINDRFPWQIKLAILQTMGLLICKAGDEMRKFVAALQPIFLKCLPDATQAIRESAAKNLGYLTRLSPRIDPLINQLVTLAMKVELPTRNAYLSAMAEAFVVGGEKTSSAIRIKTGTVLSDMLGNLDDGEENVIAMASCLGSFCKYCEIAYMSDLLNNRLTKRPPTWTQRLMDGALMATIAKHCPSRLVESNAVDLFKQTLTKFVKDDAVPVKKSACRAAARVLQSDIRTNFQDVAVPVIYTCLNPDQSTELHEEALKSVQLICYKDPSLLKDWLNDTVPLICALAREANGNKKLSCETALSLLLELSDGFVTVHAFLAENPGATAKALLVEPYLRRIQRFTRPTEYEFEKY